MFRKKIRVMEILLLYIYVCKHWTQSRIVITIKNVLYRRE